MPEAYTHTRIGTMAAQAVGFPVSSADGFAVGCQGPDILFCYQILRKKENRKPDLPSLGNRMHLERTGAFLRSLLKNAKTDFQRSYAAGFLCHYAADCQLHPYVYAVTKPDQLYGMEGGHGYFEIAVDSELHRTDFGDGAIPLSHSYPKLKADELAELAALFSRCTNEVYGTDIQPMEVAEAYHATRFFRGMFTSRWRIKWALFWLVERLVLRSAGFVTSHISPATLKKELPARWTHPTTQQPMQGDVHQLIQQAQQRAQALLEGYTAWQNGEIPFEKLAALIGNISYDSGVACAEETE